MKRLLFLLLISCVLIDSAKAQNPDTTTVLKYEDAIKIALQNNVNLNQQKNTLYSRQVQKNASIAALGPNLFLQGQGFRNEGQQPNPENGDLQNLVVDQFFSSVNANMTLFNGFSRVNQLKQSIQLFKAQTSYVNRVEQDVMFNVTIQFLQVLLDQELVRIARESVKTQTAILDQTRESVTLGVRAESDLYNQDAQLKNYEVIALRAQVALDNDKATLAQTLQLDPSIPFELDFPRLDASTISLNQPLDSLYTIGLTHRQDLQQLEYQVEANEFLLKSSASGYYPSVNLFANYGSSYYSSLKEDPNYGTFKNQFGTVFPNTTYGFSFTIPVFNRLANRSQRVFNRVTHDNSKLQLDNLKKTIKIDVQRAYNNYKAAIDSYQASLVGYQSGELALKTQEESYLLGVANQVTLAQANQTFILSAAAKAQAEVTLIFQDIMLQYALGTLQIDDIARQ